MSQIPEQSMNKNMPWAKKYQIDMVEIFLAGISFVSIILFLNFLTMPIVDISHLQLISGETFGEIVEAYKQLLHEHEDWIDGDEKAYHKDINKIQAGFSSGDIVWFANQTKSPYEIIFTNNLLDVLSYQGIRFPEKKIDEPLPIVGTVDSFLIWIMFIVMICSGAIYLPALSDLASVRWFGDGLLRWLVRRLGIIGLWIVNILTSIVMATLLLVWYFSFGLPLVDNMLNLMELEVEAYTWIQLIAWPLWAATGTLFLVVIISSFAIFRRVRK